MASDGKKHVPVVKSHHQKKSQDELVRKFSTSFRKLIESRENLAPSEVHLPGPRGVSFNPEVVETSFGGTQTPSKLKDTSIHLDFTAVDEELKKRELSQASISNGVLKEESKNCDSEPQNTLSGMEHSSDVSNAKNVVPKSSSTKISTVKCSKTASHKTDVNSHVVKASTRITKPPTPTKLNLNRKSKPLPAPAPAIKILETSQKTDKKSKDSLLNEAIINNSMLNGTLLTPDRRHTIDQFKENQETPDCFNTVSFETPAKSKMRWSIADMSCSEDQYQDSSSMTVAVRVRPFSSREEVQNECKCVISMVDNETIVTSEKTDEYRFAYDYSFWSFDKTGGSFADQEYVYGALAQPMLAKAFEGYNTCLFAYGQTGSGKSYSIMGHGQDVGIIPRFCEELFYRIESGVEGVSKTNVEISFFEIYNEKIHDLLGPSTKDKSGKKPNLKVREHPVLGPYVEGLSSYVVKSFEDIKSWLSVGNKHRATAATGMNDKSSRSHSVFTMVMTQTRLDTIEGVDHEHSITSKINLVDLAGSERQSLAKTSGDRLREGASINKSLHTLGKVISLLSDQSDASNKRKKIFIPYRDSVLTWLLKESLGGNSKTAMLATISPAAVHVEETLSTLRYAHQAKSIINQAKVNEDPKARLIRELKAEIERLKSQSAGGMSDNTDVIGASLAEIASLRSKLQQKELEMDEMTRSWQERLERSEQRKLEESRLLEKSGIALQIDNKLPNLVNLNEDPQLSEMLLYVVKEGESKVGRMMDGSTADIQLNGPLIADNHCIINNTGKKVLIIPQGDAPTYVNGDLISKSTILHHGDRVILGGDHYFRFNHPLEVVQGRKSSSNQIKDFEFARQELVRVQNARLEQELEEARRKHELELQTVLEKQKSEAERAMKQRLAQTKQEADMKLNLQKSEYEDRLSDLEHLLNEHKNKKYESEVHRREMEAIVKKLEDQKMILENEVLANRKRLQLEAEAAQHAVAQSRINHSKIVEQLEKEKQKIREDVARLEERRQRNRETPRLTPRPAVVDSSRTDLYKTALLLREANKISHHLNKSTVFSREDVEEGEGSHETVVKVTNTKLGISTFWTMAKFEDRLLQMREMYQGETDYFSGENDIVFYDPNDTWEKDDRLISPTGISPVILKNLKRQTTPRGGLPVRLSFDSNSTPGSAKTAKQSVNSVTTPINVDLSGMEDEIEPTSQPVIGMCRDMISCTIEQYCGVVLRESVADKVLHACETVKAAVSGMLEAYQTACEEGESKVLFVDSELVRGCSVQLAHGIGLLLSHCAVWKATYETDDSPSIADLFFTIISVVKKLGNKMVLLLQGCENDIDSMVAESGSEVLDGLYNLCRLCGELALATGTPTASLRDSWDDDTLTQMDQEESTPSCKLGHDVRQHFLSGCDVYLDKSLQGGLKAVESCGSRVFTIVDDNIQGQFEDILKQVELTVESSKALLGKLQELQVQLDTTMRESSVNSKADNYYYRNYLRCQGLITHVSNLADGIALLTQATETLSMNVDDGSLRRLYRCAEMVQKSTQKILVVSAGELSGFSSMLTDSNSDQSVDASLLSDSQLQYVDVAAQDIKLATNSLILNIKAATDALAPSKLSRSPSKAKRILPLSPKKSSPKHGKVKKMAALVDLMASGNGN